MKTCGDCGLCCKIMGVTALEKPAGRWRRHFGKTTGCTIYGQEVLVFAGKRGVRLGETDTPVRRA